MMGQKYFLAGFLLWLLIIVVSGIMEMAAAPEGSQTFIDMLLNTTNLIVVSVGLGVGALAAIGILPGGSKVVTFAVTIAVLVPIRHFVILDFPTVFYGSYAWFRLIFVIYGTIVFFISPIMGRFVSGG